MPKIAKPLAALSVELPNRDLTIENLKGIAAVGYFATVTKHCGGCYVAGTRLVVCRFGRRAA